MCRGSGFSTGLVYLCLLLSVVDFSPACGLAVFSACALAYAPCSTLSFGLFATVFLLFPFLFISRCFFFKCNIVLWQFGALLPQRSRVRGHARIIWSGIAEP